jgi:hypothetical protein
MQSERQFIKLSRAELVSRLNERSLHRYGSGFTDAWLDDLIKDGLVPCLERAEHNNGLRPVFFATALHYRRALQLKRLFAIGIRDRNAQRLQLFIRGYSRDVWDIRDALKSEYIGALTSLLHPMRSGYVRKNRNIGPSHEKSLMNQMGQLDPRLEAVGLKQDADFYISKVRDGVNLNTQPKNLFAGVLWVSVDRKDLSPKVQAALDSPKEAYCGALNYFRLFNKHTRWLLGRTLIDRPSFTAFMYVSCLMLVSGQFSRKDIFRGAGDLKGPILSLIFATFRSRKKGKPENLSLKK